MVVELARQCSFRVEDLEAPGMPEKFVEIVEGELIVMTPAGREHNDCGYQIVKLFDGYCRTRSELTFGGDNEGFLIRRNPDTLLSPDACLFRRRAKAKTTWLEFAPEIVVEVISPSNNATEMAFKRQRYFDAGTEQFWLVYPEQRRIEFYYGDGRVTTAEGDSEVECEGIATGLRLSLTAVFQER